MSYSLVLTQQEILTFLIRMSFEALAVLLIFFAILFSRKIGIFHILQQLGTTRLLLVMSFIVVWTLVHLIDRWQYHFPDRISFFPLTRFAMYQIGTPKELVESYQFEGRYSDDKIEQINVTGIFSSIGLPSLNTRFESLARMMESQNLSDKKFAEQQLTAYSKSLVSFFIANKRAVPYEIIFSRITVKLQKEINMEKLEKMPLFVYQSL